MAAAEAAVSSACRTLTNQDSFLLCLAGGHTPEDTYRVLASEALARQIPWARTHVFFGDERCVPPEDEASNYRMARSTLLGQLPRLRSDNVHRIAGELEPQSAARAYQAELAKLLGVSSSGGPRRGFDFLFLGMGSDGHTASLFPYSRDDPEEWVSARRHPTDGSWRVTLTPAVLNAARVVRVLVAGSGKSQRLAEVLAAPSRPDALPIQRIRAADELRFMVDRAAAEVVSTARPAARGAAEIQFLE